MRTAEHTAVSMLSVVGLAFLIGGLAGIIAVWQFSAGTQTALAFAAGGVISLTMYFRLGGFNLVPSAIFFYSLGLLGGLGGLLALAIGSRPSGGLGEVALMLLGVSVGGAIIASRAEEAPLSSRGSPWGAGDVSWSDIQWLRSFGVGMLAIAVLAIPIRDLGPIGSAFAYAGVLCVVLAAALAASRSQRIALTSYVPVVALAGAVYLVTAFSGFGRIVVAELGLGALICLGFVRPGRWSKLLLTLGVLPALVLVGLVGQVRVGGDDLLLTQIMDADVGVVVDSGVGLGSVYSPVSDAARLIDLDRRGSVLVPLEYGRTAQDLLLVIVPRALWLEKPNQLGKSIVEVLAPRYAQTNHSLAIGLWGEGFVNFRYVGFVAYPLLIAALAVKSDSVVPRIRRMDDTRRRLIFLVVVASTASGIPDLLWGGLGTFAARGGTRLLILLAIAGVLSKARRREPGRVGAAVRR